MSRDLYEVCYPLVNRRCKEDCYWYEEEHDMGATIPFCKLRKGLDPIEYEDCAKCKEYHSKYKRTNADCFRSMTDEELSSWINDHADCSCRCEARKDGCMDSDSTCKAAWLEWLKEEKR
jgi:hypothetical protein